MKPEELPLLDPLTENWQQQFSELLKDDYISKKYDREKRLQDKIKYINEFTPEIKTGKGIVLDIGPGPGEFLEICRHYGHEVIGIDAKIDDCEMGAEYIKLSKLLTERQKIRVIYEGLENLLQKGLPFKDESIYFINSQGSIEQVFKNHMLGVPHRYHKNCNLLSWDISDKLINVFLRFMSEVNRILQKTGTLFIYANGAKNTDEYNNLMVDTVGHFSQLELQYTDNKRIHKVRKF